MPVFQYQCRNCSSVFEHMMPPFLKVGVDCVSCGAVDVSRIDSTCFYPNKTFCPHDKELDGENLKAELAGIFRSSENKCGGCGSFGGSSGRSSDRCKSGGCGS